MKLKPCAHCGRDAVYYVSLLYSYFGMSSEDKYSLAIKCTNEDNCGVQMILGYSTANSDIPSEYPDSEFTKLATRWNNRV